MTILKWLRVFTAKMLEITSLKEHERKPHTLDTPSYGQSYAIYFFNDRLF